MLTEESAESRSRVEARHILDLSDVEIKLVCQEVCGMTEAVAVDKFTDSDVSGILADGFSEIDVIRPEMLCEYLSIEVRLGEELLIVHEGTELSIQSLFSVKFFFGDEIDGGVELFFCLLTLLDGIIEDTVLMSQTMGISYIEDESQQEEPSDSKGEVKESPGDLILEFEGVHLEEGT